MKCALVGLGKMGANMARRLLRGGVEVVGYNRSKSIVGELVSGEGLIAADSLKHALSLLETPRVAWLMLPSGETTEKAIKECADLLAPGDIVIDGGNSNYHDTLRRSVLLKKHGIQFIDVGTSGGVWGLQEGYCLMVGGDVDSVRQIEPLLQVLAPASDRGWARVGPVGAGHYSKMIHNGIEYGMMQAMAEGLDILKSKKEFEFNLAQVTELWRHGSVVRSWLLDLTAEGLKADQDLSQIAPYVADSGEGRWTVVEAVDQGISAPVLSLALNMRFSSQQQNSYAFRLLSMMRNAFGGHQVKSIDEK